MQNYCPKKIDKKDANEVNFTVTVQNKYGTRIWPPEDDTDWMKVGRNTGSFKSESERKSFTYTKEMHDDGVVGFEKHLENMTKGEDKIAWEINIER